LGCSVSDYQNISKIAFSKKPSKNALTYLNRKKEYYIKHPDILIKEIKNFKLNFDKEVNKFLKTISVWPNPEKPTTKKLVKYEQNYKTRAIIDFEKGVVRVESIIKNKQKLKEALIYSMLMPEDPRNVDLFSDKIALKGKPFLAGQVIDNTGKVVLYRWRANRYAEWLLKNRYRTYKENGKIIYYVEYPLAKNSENIRAKKYLPYVKIYSKKYHISKVLIMAIIKTESDFNPFAVSYVPAFGLMQIVPTTAGIEGFERAYGYKKVPSKKFLFVPKNNINIGVAYLNVLYYRYLKKIKNPLSREYLAIAAYNSGIGNVFKVFNIRKDRAIAIINSLAPQEVYKRLILRLPTDEGRRYLPKVLKHKLLFRV
jgi:membrane-bound lytic murein transglycosylase C